MANQKKSPKPTTSFGTKLKTFFKNNYKLLIFMVFFFFINCVFLHLACNQNGISFFSKRSLLIITVTTIVTIALCAFVFFAGRKNWPIEKIFLVVGSTLGIIYLFAIPIGRVPDEPAHFWKVYSISQGNLSTEANLPENIANLSNNYNKNAYKLLAERISEPISEEQTSLKVIGSNPADYLPQVVGISAGKILHLPMLITLYLGRIFGLIACITIIYFCLKYIPILKKPLFFLSCLPMTMQTFVGISYDGMIFCAAIALITIILYFIYNPETKFKLHHYLILALASILLTAVKPVYFPLCLLLFFIPTKCFNNKKQKIILIVTMLLIAIGVFLLWAMFSTVSEPGNGADTSAQIHYILSNPLRYVSILVNNMLNMPANYLNKLGQLEWLDTQTSEFYLFGILILFVLLCVEERLNSTIKSTKIFRWCTLIFGITSAVLVFTALYVQWSHVGGEIIEGVQTRYLLPIIITVPMICIPLSKGSSNATERKTLLPRAYLYAFIILSNIAAIATVMYAHI